MRKFIKVYVTEKMEKDHEECVDMFMEGIEKDCNTCSCNGGDSIDCFMDLKKHMEVDHRDIRDIAINYGFERQSRQCMEECGELIQALNKYWRNFLQYGTRTSFTFSDMVNNKEYKNLVEEIADVEIMLTQLKILLRCEDDVVEIAEQKVQRELARIRGEEVKKVVQRKLERMRGEEDEDVPFK